ncbi:serine hydrolase domain-containing protein [Arthrobacter alpinus]|uniref:serine hydrolase domain-containing protein n=1 Tax=Arthrobacter alpinus TaxID=656366 RepID=UPI0012FAA1DD|nr:serine hydrolase domain-containing protein [Arthrobacter alpinus]
MQPASGDAQLAAALARLSGRRTRRLAAGVIDSVTGSRMAFVVADEGTYFEVGSLAKVFTGMLLAEAVSRGEVQLDAMVASLLPETAGRDRGTVTLQELCTHTSGLPRLPSTPAMTATSICSELFGTDPHRSIATTSVLSLASRQELTYRGQCRYSNLGAAVLGELLARVARCEYSTLLPKRIFTSTGMLSTSLPARLVRPREGGRRPGAAPSHGRKWLRPRHRRGQCLGKHDPAGQLSTGRLRSGCRLDSTDRAHHPQHPHPPRPGVGHALGYRLTSRHRGYHGLAQRAQQRRVAIALTGWLTRPKQH